MSRRSKLKAKELASSYEFAFRRRYNLPPTDERYLNATREDIITDYWAHYYTENGVGEEFEDDDFEAEKRALLEDDDDWEEV